MAQDLQVHCINKTDRHAADERIKNIGGLNADRTRWKLDIDAAIAGIEAGTWSFYTMEAGKKVRVIIAKSAAGRKYLKTENDGEQPNNLLSLPECP